MKLLILNTATDITEAIEEILLTDTFSRLKHLFHLNHTKKNLKKRF